MVNHFSFVVMDEWIDIFFCCRGVWIYSGRRLSGDNGHFFVIDDQGGVTDSEGIVEVITEAGM